MIEKLGKLRGSEGAMDFDRLDSGAFHALVVDRLLLRETVVQRIPEYEIQGHGSDQLVDYPATIYTITARCYTAVDGGFKEEEAIAPLPVSTLAHSHPPEIAHSIDRLRGKYPDPKKFGFLIMRFAAAKPLARIVDIVKETAAKHGVTVVRADETEFHADLWGNVRTHLHGCGFGIAVYERIESDEPNANVGLEVGYLMAMNKPVLLLKDKTVQTLQADLAGKLYKEFDPHDPAGTVPDQVTRWLADNGIIVPRNE